MTATTETTSAQPLAADELRRLDAYWRAANYLSVGQVYLLDNPLLREPLRPEHIKPRLLGPLRDDAGPQPVYVHLNRAIRQRDLNAIYVTGPGHGGPALVANAYLEGDLHRAVPGRLLRTRPGSGRCSASSPSRVGSRATSRPRSRARSTRAASSAMPSSTRSALPSTTPTWWSPASWVTARPRPGPLAASWHSNKFLNARTDGAVLPILHLNGYKIANPTILARIPEDELVALFRGYGWEPLLVEGDEPGAGAPGLCGRARPVARPDCGDPARRARRGRDGEAGLADDRAADAEGLDGPEGRRRSSDRGQLALPPGADDRRP